MSTSTHRRDFLRTAKQVGLGAAALNLSVESARGFAANDTINIGAIGTGGRCRRLMTTLAQVPNVRLTAVCDIYDGHLQMARQISDKKALATKSFLELLDRSDVDAVVIGSPDHWHVPMTIAACQAGKDVYVEKPLTHEISEGPAVIQAQNDSGQIVQVGMQQRSMPQLIKARERFRDGVIGRTSKVHLTWNRNRRNYFRRRDHGIDPKQVDWKAFLGNAPDQPYDEYRFRTWRWFWDFGGGILTDLMVHYIDVVHWFFESNEPTRAAAIGHNYNSKDLWETPDTIHCLLDYPDKEYQVYFEGTFCNARNRAMMEFMGKKATLYMDRGRYEIIPESDEVQAEEWVPGNDQRKGLDFYKEPNGELLHLKNWVECVRTRAQPNCTVEDGVRAANAAHLGNQSFRSSQLAMHTG